MRSPLGKRRSPFHCPLPFAELLRCQAFWRVSSNFKGFFRREDWRNFKPQRRLQKMCRETRVYASVFIADPWNILELSRKTTKTRHLIGSLNNILDSDWFICAPLSKFGKLRNSLSCSISISVIVTFSGKIQNIPEPSSVF